MEANQPTSTVKRSLFTPGSVSFLAGILLFLLPFVNIKCGDTPIKEVKGIELVTGFTIKNKATNQSIFGNTDPDQSNSGKKEIKEPDKYALIGFGLGVLGFIVALFARGRSAVASFLGGFASVALIVLMIEIKGDSKLAPVSNGNNNADIFGSNFGNDIIRVEFTPWFYVTIAVFFIAAFLCWPRTKQAKT